MLAWSGVVLAPFILAAFEPEGVRHPMVHQVRSLVAVWLYVLGVVLVLHAVTEGFARVVVRAGRDALALRWQALGLAVALGVVTLASLPAAPVLAAVCPGIAGHESTLVLRGVLLGGVYAAVGIASGNALRARIASRVARERAERAAVEARLDALTARTQPHFVANALNTIAQTLRDDPDAAERLVEQLGQLFSHALSGSATGTVTLMEEIDAARSYLAVQAARFGTRLEVSLSGEALGDETPVPALCVLPLVENAVLHGLSTSAARVRVELDARRGASGFTIEIRDDGPGPDASRHVGHGTGLRELQQRLALAYPEGGARVDLVRKAAWTVATLILPAEAPKLRRGDA